MFKEIDNLSENLMLSSRIKRLMLVLDNYFTKRDYDYNNFNEARECCINYNEVQVLVETIFDLVVENDKKLNENMDILIEKEKTLRNKMQEVA